jgi:calcineurin-like phosphoesterase family protein/Big-like domain-containing protein
MADGKRGHGGAEFRALLAEIGPRCACTREPAGVASDRTGNETMHAPARIAAAGIGLVALIAGPAAGPATAASATFAPTADAPVDASQPNTNFGTAPKLRTDGSPVVRSYLRFDVQGWASGATATLRLTPTSSLKTGLQVVRVADTTWGEGSINFNNAPLLGSALGTTTPPKAGTVLSTDVTAAVTGNGPLSLALASADQTAEALASREAGPATAPQLVIETPGTDTTSPAPVLTSPAAGATVTTATPTIAGTAGTASGDESTVTVLLWPGTDTSGSPQRSLPAAALAGGAFSVTPNPPLGDGLYTVLVEQRDAAGNVGRSPPRSFTVDTSSPPPPGPVTLTPVADAFVDASQPNTNFGTNVKLRTDGSPVVRSYMRFNVQGFAPGATRATLRLFATTSLNTGLQVASVANTTWGEATITATNAPAVGSTIATTPPPQANTRSSVDVTDAISGSGPITFALTSTNATAEALASRETGANGPQLVLASADTAAPTPALTQPPDGSTTTDTTPVFAGTAGTATGDSSTVSIPVWEGTGTSGIPLATLTATVDSGTGAFSVEPAKALEGGTYTARADQDDAAGNHGHSAAAFVVDVPDTTAPDVSLTTPVAGATLSDPTPTLAGTAATRASDSSSVRVRVWAGSDTSSSPVVDETTTRAANGSFSVDAPVALADGDYTARADQDDAASNHGHSAEVAFTISATDPTIAAAGDIACKPGANTTTVCKQGATSDLLLQLGPDAVLALGDTQYDAGEYPNYLQMFDPSWGRVKQNIFPVLGNHEYGNSTNAGCDVTTAGDPRSYACGYFDYFNGKGNLAGRAGQRGQGYYAFDVGQWRIYAMNSNCGRSGAPNCSSTGAQVQWLRSDLEANPRQCQVMFMHHPMFSSDVRNFDTEAYRDTLRPMWTAFNDHGGDLVLTGHTHFYERFQPMTPQGAVDTNGIQSIIVGTGGKDLQQPSSPPEPNRAVQSSTSFGVLELTLHSSSYEWRFVPIAGQTFTDSGSRGCH